MSMDAEKLRFISYIHGYIDINIAGDVVMNIRIKLSE